MSDRFLQKILDATAKMREQKGEMELSEKANNIRKWLKSMAQGNNASLHIRDKAMLEGCFKLVLGDDWYAEGKKELEPIRFALVFARDNVFALFFDRTYITKDGRYCSGNIKRPATDEEIYSWYEEFLNG